MPLGADCLGSRVLEARSGAAALEVVVVDQHQIHLVPAIDLMMPGMNGQDL
jgi:CheY-like chemotaxis protein